MNEKLTKHDRYAQKKAFKEASKKIVQNQQRTKKIVIALAVVVVVILAVFGVRSAITHAPTIGPLPNPIKGNSTAPVQIIEYADFECPACKGFEPYLTQAFKEFGDSIALTYKYFPLTTVHPNAYTAAEAAQCAYVQGKFWAYHDLLYSEQTTWTPERDPNQDFIKYAQQLNLNVETFKQCLATQAGRPTVDQGMAEANSANLNSTPSFFINGKQYTGLGSYTSFEQAIKDALQKVDPKALENVNQASNANNNQNATANANQ